MVTPVSTQNTYSVILNDLNSSQNTELTATIKATGAGEIWVTHGQEDALVHWCKTQGLAARPLDLVGYGDEDSGEGDAVAAEGESA